MRVRNEHWNILLNFSEEHNQIITNKFSGIQGRQDGQKIWQMLSNTLNSLGMGEKKPDEWKKTLADWKSKTKSKAAKIKLHQNATGGGGPLLLKLTENEERLLELMGKTAIEGDEGIVEFGMKRKLKDTTIKSIEQQPFTSKGSDHNYLSYYKVDNVVIEDNVIIEDIVVHSSDKEELLNIPNSSSIVKSPITSSTPVRKNISTSTKRRRNMEKFSDRIECMNADTLGVLKNIDTNIEKISINIAVMADSLKKISDKLP